MADIFLSYNREDQATARTIATALQGEGLEVWWDTVLRAGQTYDEVTERQLHNASAVVVLWSSRSVKSKWVRAEATLGDRKSALIPVMIEPCDRPIMFELIQTADLTKWQGDLNDPQWKAFVEDVREHVQRRKAAPAAPAPTPAPAAGSTPVAASNDTIEAAFWMSIKDDGDPEELQSYLERFPQGHFVALARKRLAALTAPQAPPAAAAPPPAAAPAAPPPQAAEPAMAKPVAPPPKPEPLKPAPKADAFQQRAAAPASKKKGGSPLPLILGVLVLAGAGAAAFVFMPGLGGSSAPAGVTAEAPPAAPPAPPEIQAASAAATPTASPAAAPPSKTFSDCEHCPDMTRLPGGAFTMGSPATEPGHTSWEGPQRQVTVPAFAIGTHEVTFAEWDACVAAGGCNAYTPPDKDWGRDTRPVIMVSWNDAKAYLKWLSGKTGKTYRLPTEAEWEYAARGGTSTAYWWGDKYVSANAPHGKTDPVGSRKANGFGLLDVTGNAAEWVEDCYVNTFSAAPTDGSAVVTSNCQRVIRGGGWKANAGDLRIANRSRLSPSTRDTAIGFRVATAD